MTNILVRLFKNSKKIENTLFFRPTESSFQFCRLRPPRRPPRLIDHPATESIRREREYAYLFRATTDKDGLESIRALHRQLDDDKDGSIEPSETGDFIRGDLKKVCQISN